MRHRYVAVLLEQKRKELGENKRTFGKRLYPESSLVTAGSNYSAIANQRLDIPDERLPFASVILGIPVETLRTI